MSACTQTTWAQVFEMWLNLNTMVKITTCCVLVKFLANAVVKMCCTTDLDIITDAKECLDLTQHLGFSY